LCRSYRTRAHWPLPLSFRQAPRSRFFTEEVGHRRHEQSTPLWLPSFCPICSPAT
jgi:hypothetical protein